MSTGNDKRTFWGILRNTFGRGLVVIVPIVITFWVLHLLFEAVDGIASPIFDKIFERHIPGIGFMTMVVLILLVGALSRNLIARTVFRSLERLLSSIPLARTIYTAMKDIINAFQPGKKGRSFREVVMIEYPRQGLQTIGFVTNEISLKRQNSSEEMISVYIPNPPNPTSGFLVLVPRAGIRVLDMTVEEGLKFVLSGGIVTTGNLTFKQ
ncbi:MAG: DUF502 domain-containing protein [Ignavibacteriales bacterium]|nr:DUF502 domain-containing protein [Ignavibacteriales bacterium]